MNDPNEPRETPGHEIRPLLRARDVAALADITEKTVYRAVTRGELPAVRVGRAVRFRPESIERWLAAQEA